MSPMSASLNSYPQVNQMKFIAGFLFALFLIVTGNPCKADTIGVHLFSRHGSETFERTYPTQPTQQIKYNNDNFGLYYIADNGFTAGGYKNSYYRNSFYLGWTWEFDKFYGVTPSITVAGVTGYDWCRGMGLIRPMVMPSARVDVLGLGVKLSGLPVGKAGFMHLSIEKSF